MCRFTDDELLQMRLFDAEIDATYIPTTEDRKCSNNMDRDAAGVKNPGRYTPEVAESQRAYRESNRETIKARKATWYQKNKERLNAESSDYHKLRRRYFQDLQNERRRQNPEEANRKQREYRRSKYAKTN